MKHGWMAVVGLCLGSMAAATIGCDGESKLNVVTEEGAAAPHVNLPTVPTLPAPPPINHTDGSFTIYGVRHSATRDSNLWSKQQRVHGFIVSVYTARNERGQPCTEADRCVEERPHMYISDARAERDPAKMMMVTGYATFQHEIEAARTAARGPSAHRRAAGADRRRAREACPHRLRRGRRGGRHRQLHPPRRQRPGRLQRPARVHVAHDHHARATPANAPPALSVPPEPPPHPRATPSVRASRRPTRNAPRRSAHRSSAPRRRRRTPPPAPPPASARRPGTPLAGRPSRTPTETPRSRAPAPPAAARASPRGTTRLTSPIARASSACTARPVSTRSSARPRPTTSGSRAVPPSMRGTPHRRQNTPSTASSSITRRSHQSASSRPPATAKPEMAAITGLFITIRDGPIGPSPVGSSRLASPVAMALRSAPAQKVPPSPQSTATRASSSARRHETPPLAPPRSPGRRRSSPPADRWSPWSPPRPALLAPSSSTVTLPYDHRSTPSASTALACCLWAREPA